ncbi:NUDIX hydrolase domain-like protein [Suillus fuscotomentosus]|uniref:Oxidized purine nucleoside triphosphate hydrolase n=1 Tax=Suillus fuscotomentosus TaxID=1912939 RepID=A0AAD4EFH9_9AGAM|nr:NUDIX hydrolase domain-like protein [Suillus fuscotomentosus]KAG1904039.1 NUDIX hydrolase domain-like protein [Suillus fuscotomentosus]
MTSGLPPGLEGNLAEYVQGGVADWLPFDHKRFYTNAFIIQGDKILLGLKKRGFGINKYNGFGGKVEPGETLAEAAMRELKEEAGIDAPLEHAGSLLFVTNAVGWAFQIEIFSARSYSGTPTESDEMQPKWFSFESPATSDADAILPPIPYEMMWDGDAHWLPLLVQGRKFVGRIDSVTQDDGEFAMTKHWFSTVISDD